MPHFLYRIQPARPDMLTKGPTIEEAEAIGDHAEYLEHLAEEGTVVMAGRTLNTDDTAFGIVVFAADSESHARALMHEDPAVQRGIMRAELFPYRIAFWSTPR